MGLKKSKDYRFTFQDEKGHIRVVVLKVEHHQEGQQDTVKVNVNGDGVALELHSFLLPTKIVKTRSRF